MFRSSFLRECAFDPDSRIRRLDGMSAGLVRVRFMIEGTLIAESIRVGAKLDRVRLVTRKIHRGRG
jgi:hypothetical protein